MCFVSFLPRQAGSSSTEPEDKSVLCSALGVGKSLGMPSTSSSSTWSCMYHLSNQGDWLLRSVLRCFIKQSRPVRGTSAVRLHVQDPLDLTLRLDRGTDSKIRYFGTAITMIFGRTCECNAVCSARMTVHTFVDYPRS